MKSAEIIRVHGLFGLVNGFQRQAQLDIKPKASQSRGAEFEKCQYLMISVKSIAKL
ncbi:hypothetical protein [Polaromonas vacuolata]|uniref:hypothetical protein n=1 Tax=Polaromonas vacuolata TaxID=37448 RepID=UPI0014571DEB|nr:hypothetical protein [Polaromonas vacuolata]